MGVINMYCMYCGEQISDNSKYCKYCGKHIYEENVVDEPKEESASREYNIIDDNSDADTNEAYAEAPQPEKEEVIIDDIFLTHMPKRKKILLFLAAVFLTAVVAAAVFAMFFPQLI